MEGLSSPCVSDLRAIVDDIAAEMADVSERGQVADYIPDLACISPSKFGISIALETGQCLSAGDADDAFSIQSITKVFTLAMALGAIGDGLWQRIGREPSGSAFNSIVQLETESGIPRNPFINSGAIVLSDVLLAGYEPAEVLGEFVRFVRALVGEDSIIIDREVAQGEERTGFRNVALANYMRSFGNIHHPVDKVLGVYFHHCALAMSCRQLALAGRFLAFGGRNPDTGYSVVPERRARRILALMMSCGHYDGSGEFAFRVGLPGKSGVGGGIMAIAPGKASIAVWSPGLNERGNSQLGTMALEMLVHRTGWSVFDAGR